jgi:hypothetical protein
MSGPLLHLLNGLSDRNAGKPNVVWPLKVFLLCE